MPKTWQQKFDNGRPPHVEIAERSGMGIAAGARMLIADPATVAKFVRQVPKGKSVGVADLRAAMASEFGADVTCLLTTGIFLRIAAECALEELASGVAPSKVTPFWRAIDPKGPLAKKLSCGSERVKELRQAEGIV